ncbi:MAG TPA: CBS domain-containing protein [Aquihabitans sp.]|nr:CBS domain-containing protein [Aquihabitans sp.]
MQVSVLLQAKGSEVVTVAPQCTVAEVLAVLERHRIGAVVVTDDGRSIEGVLSERDIVRALAHDGADALARPAAALMTAEVVTCEPDTTVERLMAVMTERRIRHVPVLVRGELAGVVSIGDVVKHRVATLEHETQAMQDYIANPY